MKSVTPEQTIHRLGWKAAHQSLQKSKTFGSPKPESFSQLYNRYLRCEFSKWLLAKRFVHWAWQWCKWSFQSVKFYWNVWKQSRIPFVAEYKKLAEQAVPSREAFKRCKMKMHLTEDEIFAQGNRILRGENLPAFERPKELQ